MTMTRLFLLSALALVAGCSTPPDYYHTLRPSGAAAPSGGSARDAQRLLAIGPVTVPDALKRDEWVIRTGETGAMVYDHQLWTQGLSADVAQSLVDYLNRGSLPDGLWADAGPTGSGSGADLERPAPLRVRVQVLRFDSVLVPAPAVSDEIRWTIECLPSDASLGPVDAGRYRSVRTAVRDAAEPAPGAGANVDASQQRFDRVARAHSETVRLVAEDVAAALRATAAERAQACITGH
ncbi:PqiC family protein [Scleromatobacter humisilvae]|uniref:ABC-type transport auxiliary lipoprotein family protein n=1 Tax=Scleromatobacter humisilvae TaxID=2897159 RepID=A0A9X1YGJ1_9BURK|nr:ABC-type transport auxiliary lipoprotein family protein [Scleromatobacter humisilvae]MCK9685541.1 ABC-type transport auxiliary lipoprotein family protein [Scleromatobacter humisilvae]